MKMDPWAAQRLNKEIAQKVMGWHTKEWHEDSGDGPDRCLAWFNSFEREMCGSCLPNFASDFSETEKIIDTMCAKGYQLSLKKLDRSWVASFTDLNDQIGLEAEERATNKPQAICIAALKALEISEESQGIGAATIIRYC